MIKEEKIVKISTSETHQKVNRRRENSHNSLLHFWDRFSLHQCFSSNCKVRVSFGHFRRPSVTSRFGRQICAKISVWSNCSSENDGKRQFQERLVAVFAKRRRICVAFLEGNYTCSHDVFFIVRQPWRNCGKKCEKWRYASR